MISFPTQSKITGAKALRSLANVFMEYITLLVFHISDEKRGMYLKALKESLMEVFSFFLSFKDSSFLGNFKLFKYYEIY